MSFNAWLKSKTADKVLRPLRKQIIDLIDEGSSVLEIGCGTGDLLFRAAGKIEYGLGLDTDAGMIDFAHKKRRETGDKNVEFTCKKLHSLNNPALRHFNITTSTLCLHEMAEQDAISTLSLLGQYSEKIIIADYTIPTTAWGKVSVELDEIISGHYLRFRKYRKCGGIPYLAKMAGLEANIERSTAIDGISIWLLNVSNTHNNCS